MVASSWMSQQWKVPAGVVTSRSPMTRPVPVIVIVPAVEVPDQVSPMVKGQRARSWGGCRVPPKVAPLALKVVARSSTPLGVKRRVSSRV